MKLTSAVLLTAAACVMLVSCARVKGQIYNDLDGGIYLKVYGKSGAVIAYGELPGRTRLGLFETSGKIGRIEYTVGSGRSCQIDESTLRKDIAIGQDQRWRLHLRGC
jgi:hypothetical protein